MGGGGFVNLIVEVVNGFRLLTNNYWSDGGGRYIYGEAPDLSRTPTVVPALPEFAGRSIAAGHFGARQNRIDIGAFAAGYSRQRCSGSTASVSNKLSAKKPREY